MCFVKIRQVEVGEAREVGFSSRNMMAIAFFILAHVEVVTFIGDATGRKMFQAGIDTPAHGEFENLAVDTPVTYCGIKGSIDNRRTLTPPQEYFRRRTVPFGIGEASEKGRIITRPLPPPNCCKEAWGRSSDGACGFRSPVSMWHLG